MMSESRDKSFAPAACEEGKKASKGWNVGHARPEFRKVEHPLTKQLVPVFSSNHFAIERGLNWYVSGNLDGTT